MKQIPIKALIVCGTLICAARGGVTLDVPNTRIDGYTVWEEWSFVGRYPVTEPPACIIEAITDKWGGRVTIPPGGRCRPGEPEETFRSYIDLINSTGIILGGDTGERRSVPIVTMEVYNKEGEARGGHTTMVKVLPGTPPVSCGFFDFVLEIEHGTIDVASAQGHRKGILPWVVCGKTVDVKFSSKPDPIVMSNGQTSHITINGANPAVVRVPQGTTSVDITSVLTGNPSKTGPASGSAVITAEVL